jgi:prepilin-type N-terminal cleavage/methylation domain-containing protein
MKQGFSILEILISVSIIGVLAALGFSTFLGFRQTTEIQEAQTQFAQDLERVRQLARRYSVTYVMKTPSTTEYQAYALKADKTEDTTIPGLALKKLPNNAVFEIKPAVGSEPQYVGPFGRLDSAATATCYSIKIAASGRFAEIHLLGVTGRVTPRAVRTTGSPCV